MLGTDFSVDAWAAWAPTLHTTTQWRAWADNPVPTPGAGAPVLAEMPSAHRRRLERLGRMAAHAVHACQGGELDAPVVFASRYGDAARALALLADLARGEPLSPTAFGLSVHNAIAALIGIARGDRGDVVAVASGASSAAAGVLEATALIADGASTVLLVACDVPLPEGYEHFMDEPPASWAWAWRLAAPRFDRPCFRLASAPGDPEDAPASGLPFGLGLLQAMLSAAPAWSQVADGRRWTLHCHG